MRQSQIILNHSEEGTEVSADVKPETESTAEAKPEVASLSQEEKEALESLKDQVRMRMRLNSTFFKQNNNLL